MTHCIAVVTGGSNGIGAAICGLLLARNATVINLDIVPPAQTPTGDYHYYGVDLSKADETRSMAARVLERFNVNCLVNNAGVARPADLGKITDDELDYGVNLHLRAAIILSQAFLPAMKAGNFGRIVNISTRAILGKKGRSVYGGTKAALAGMTRTWALELGEFGITVNAIAPGPIVTELFKKSNTPEQASKLVQSTCVGRGGTPQDVANAVEFFLSESSGFVTGQLLHVCGGASLSAVSF